MQTTSHLLMIRPVNFGFNAETAVNNVFQTPLDETGIQEKALAEFNEFVRVLRSEGMDVLVIDDEPEPATPDSIFPNNWVSFHEDGTVCLYPMFAENRRKERRPAIIKKITDRFQVRKTIDLSTFEDSHLFLEGTGSMVLDREYRVAYACLSPRTDQKLLSIWCDQMGYKPVPFTAEDGEGRAVYHTNVMMGVADQFVVICLDSIVQKEERALVVSAIRQTGKEIVDITPDQMHQFAGNMLQVENVQGERLLVMSTRAYESLTTRQVKKLESFNRIIHSALDYIETCGGGSARCMLAEIHLAPKIDP